MGKGRLEVNKRQRKKAAKKQAFLDAFMQPGINRLWDDMQDAFVRNTDSLTNWHPPLYAWQPRLTREEKERLEYRS